VLEELVRTNRSYRRFKSGAVIDRRTLEGLVDLARLSPSAANRQPLKYVLSCDPGTNAIIFPHLAWAGYLTDWSGPAEGERPSAYIVVLGDTEISQSFSCDHGIAIQSMLLGAAEQGLGGCIVGSIERDGLRRALSIADRYEILLVLALGVPGETVVLEEVDSSGDIKYWRDREDIHHVPKRRLADVIVKTYG
jgi:nitroreductase